MYHFLSENTHVTEICKESSRGYVIFNSETFSSFKKVVSFSLLPKRWEGSQCWRGPWRWWCRWGTAPPRGRDSCNIILNLISTLIIFSFFWERNIRYESSKSCWKEIIVSNGSFINYLNNFYCSSWWRAGPIIVLMVGLVLSQPREIFPEKLTFSIIG